jgi:hypothetical protein
VILCIVVFQTVRTHYLLHTCEGVDCIHLAPDRNQWLGSCEDGDKTCGFHKRRGIS